MLNIWLPPQTTKKNNTFTTQVRLLDQNCFTELYPYNVRVGHQDDSFNESSMVIFDFDDEVEIQVIYNKGDIQCFDVRPHSYGIQCQQTDANTLLFRLKQDKEAPRKLVVSINNDFESECLHILTNPCEQDTVGKDAENVYYIAEGDEIPLVLPAGKDTYYFAKGVHHLPKGLWAELDLEQIHTINTFELHQGNFTLSDCYVDGEKSDPQKFIIEGKCEKHEEYSMVFDGCNNKSKNLLTIEIEPAKLRYIRLTLLGANIEKGWKFSNVIKSFKAYDAFTGDNVALGKAIDGAIKSYKNVTSDDLSDYATPARNANWHSAESFFISRDGYKLYLEAGSVVKGAVVSDGMNHISISGRGILDASELEHINPGCGEARTGAIWLTGGNDYFIEGITVLDAPMWQIVLNYSENIYVKNINLLGYVVNADGIHVSGCKNVEMSGVFVRSCDDLIVIYHYGATENITVKNSVFFNDNAHVFLYGLGETPNAYMKNLNIFNCDIISQQEAPWEPYRFSGVFKLWAHGGNYIEDVFIKDVRIDDFAYLDKGCVFQLRTELRFKGEHPGSYIKNVHFENVSCESENETPSLISGINYAKESDRIAVGEDVKDQIPYSSYISDITFVNYTRNGKKVRNMQEANIELCGDVKGVSFR